MFASIAQRDVFKIFAMTLCAVFFPGFYVLGSDQSKIQDGSALPQYPLVVKPSCELVNNRIGGDYGGDLHWKSSLWETVNNLGHKWVRIAFTDCSLNWQCVQKSDGSYIIDQDAEQLETARSLARCGINVVLNLGCGVGQNRPDKKRFRSRNEIEEYCRFVRTVVGRFKDYVKYYEIWNEPNVDAPWGNIAAEDYVKLVKHVVPVIRDECPDAKIVIGAVGGRWDYGFQGYGDFGRYTFDGEFLEYVLKSGVAPHVDVISWHPFYGHRPDDQYYRTYPRMVQRIKQLATSQGFKGEYLAEEMLWRIEQDEEPQKPVSPAAAAKYFCRTIVTHLGLDVTATVSGYVSSDDYKLARDAIARLSTVLAGARPICISVDFQSAASDVESYEFSLPNGNRLLAIWRDGIAIDSDPKVRAVLTCPELSATSVKGIDVWNGVEQSLHFENAEKGLVVRDLLIKDYPLILELAK